MFGIVVNPNDRSAAKDDYQYFKHSTTSCMAWLMLYTNNQEVLEREMGKLRYTSK